jgi:uncharacterized membrane protein
MRIVANVLGVLLTLIGIGWFLQGIGVMPGSFMTGQTRWAVYGAIAVVVGLGLLVKFRIRKVILNTIATVVLIMGTIWILQGINVLPGSMMSGQSQWAIRGAVLDVVGVLLLLRAGRIRSAGRV